MLGQLNPLKFIWKINQLKVRDDRKEIPQLKLWNGGPNIQHNLDFYLDVRIALWEKGMGEIVSNIVF